MNAMLVMIPADGARRILVRGLMDYRCTGGRFLLSARGVKILNSHSLSSSETELRNGMNSWKARLLSSAERYKAIGGL
jgi:hypothetical protein